MCCIHRKNHLIIFIVALIPIYENMTIIECFKKKTDKTFVLTGLRYNQFASACTRGRYSTQHTTIFHI